MCPSTRGSDEGPAAERAVAVAQGVYFFATGVWPLLHMRSFLKVTGPKRDLWLVRTVGALVAVVGAALLVGARRETTSQETRVLAAGAAASLAAVDVVYVSKGRIPPIYLLDAVAELALLGGWAAAWQLGRRAE